MYAFLHQYVKVGAKHGRLPGSRQGIIWISNQDYQNPSMYHCQGTSFLQKALIFNLVWIYLLYLVLGTRNQLLGNSLDRYQVLGTRHQVQGTRVILYILHILFTLYILQILYILSSTYRTYSTYCTHCTYCTYCTYCTCCTCCTYCTYVCAYIRYCRQHLPLCSHTKRVARINKLLP